MLSNRNYIKKVLFSKATVIAILVVLIFILKPTWNIYQKKVEIARNVKKLNAALDQLKQRESELLMEIENLKTSRGTEEEIREKFNVTKEGENLVVIVPSSDNEAENKKPKGWWSKAWAFITGIFK